ncbi:MAG: hypothetical protein ACTMI6_07995 [Pseudomonas bubulae]
MVQAPGPAPRHGAPDALQALPHKACNDLWHHSLQQLDLKQAPSQRLRSG